MPGVCGIFVSIRGGVFEWHVTHPSEKVEQRSPGIGFRIGHPECRRDEVHRLLELATAVAAKRFSVKERSQNLRDAAVGSGKSRCNGIDRFGRRFVIDESPTKFGCNVPGSGGVGGNDAQDIFDILPAVHAPACRDRLAKDEFLSVVVKPGLELDFSILKQPAANPPTTQAAGDFHHIVL